MNAEQLWDRLIETGVKEFRCTGVERDFILAEVQADHKGQWWLLILADICRKRVGK